MSTQYSSASPMQRDDRFLRGVFCRFLLPTVLSVLGGTVNGLVDSAIVGNMLGQSALAAINLCGPIFLCCCVAGSLIGSGAGLLSAALLGKNDRQKSCVCYTVAVLAELLLGTIILLAGTLFQAPIIRALGADAETLPLVEAYARMAFWGAPVKCLLYIPFNFLRLDGKPGAVSVALIAMTVLNGVLDVVFLRLGWGMAGASLASIIGTCLGVGIGFARLRGGDFRFVSVKGGAKLLPRLLYLGLPPALNNLLGMARLLLLNRFLMASGGSAAVAVFTILCSLSDFTLCILSGVPQTASPMVGVYRSECNAPGLRLLMRLQLVWGEVMVCILALVIALLSGQVCAVFGLAETAEAVLALRLFALSLPPAMLCSCLIFFYNACGRVGLANGLTLCRVFLFAVPLAPLLVRWGLSVWLFQPLAEVLSLVVIVPVLKIISRRKALSPVLLLDERLEREGRIIDFSVADDPKAIADASERISGFCESNDMTPKQQMAVSLSIEELLLIQFAHCFPKETKGTADVRVFAVQGAIGLRIRNGGRQFNPIAYCAEHEEEDEAQEMLGIRLIQRLAQTTEYQRTLGVNTLTILL